MSNLKSRIRAKSKGLLRTKDITLPASGELVRVRGLMLEAQLRVSSQKDFKQTATMIALALLDPETGEPVFNPNDLDDLTAIGEMHGDDATAIVETASELSGATVEARKALEGNSPREESASSSSSSAPGSATLRANSDVD